MRSEIHSCALNPARGRKIFVPAMRNVPHHVDPQAHDCRLMSKKLLGFSFHERGQVVAGVKPFGVKQHGWIHDRERGRNPVSAREVRLGQGHEWGSEENREAVHVGIGSP